MDDQLAAADVVLTDAQLALLQGVGTTRSVRTGDVLYRPGDEEVDFVALVDTCVDVIGGRAGKESVIISFGPHQFLGEINMLSNQRSVVTARVRQPGTIVTLPRSALRQILATETELADVIVAAFLGRREILHKGVGIGGVQVLGSRSSAELRELRQYLVRSGFPHRWIDLDADAGCEAQDLLDQFGLDPSETPVVVTALGLLRNPTPGELAAHLGLQLTSSPGRLFDLAIVGAGPAGLAATVYGASEGLDTVAVEGVAVGGQAGASSRIENYLGFPQGVSGQELTDRATVQGRRFGAQIASPCPAVALRSAHGLHSVVLADGTEILSRSVIVASGAHYRRPDVEGWRRLEGAGIYYAATQAEGDLVAGRPVAVLGGGNSAGQAATYLAQRGCDVRLIIRAESVSKSMSRYLVDRIEADPRISVTSEATVTELGGASHLHSLTVRQRAKELRWDVAALFCFIGAVPASGWLNGQLCLDDRGFIPTDRDIPANALGPAWAAAAREPLPFESSIPGVFVVGDIRAGSVKRVAAAVGEGSAAVRSVHVHLAANEPARSLEMSVELTTLELLIARSAVAGCNYASIAADLRISPRTVEWHMGKVFTKFGVDSRAQLLERRPDLATA